LGNQLLVYPRAMTVLGAMMGVFALVPGLPMFPFLVLGVLAGLMSYTLHHHGPLEPALAQAPSPGTAKGVGVAAATTTSETRTLDKLEELLHLDPFQVEMGYGLVALADKRHGGDLLDRVTSVRRNFAQEMGVIIPPIRLRDNLQLGPNEYRFLLKGNPVAQGELRPGHWLAMNAAKSKVVLKGVPTIEPVFQLPATWVADAERKTAEVGGFTVVDAPSVLVTHLSEVIRRRSHEILSRQDVQVLLDNLKLTHPTLVNELVPAQLNVGQVQRILQNLLAEGISIRNLAGILEKVSDHAPFTKNPDELSEHARRALGAQITRLYQMQSDRLRAITLDPRLEQTIAQGVRLTPTDVSLVLEPGLARHITDALGKLVQQMLAAGHPPVVLCSPQIRLSFRRFFESAFADLTVIAYSEIPPRVEIQNAATIPSVA
jgi:flagellar biosynthesis protein FlhA